MEYFRRFNSVLTSQVDTSSYLCLWKVHKRLFARNWMLFQKDTLHTVALTLTYTVQDLSSSSCWRFFKYKAQPGKIAFNRFALWIDPLLWYVRNTLQMLWIWNILICAFKVAVISMYFLCSVLSSFCLTVFKCLFFLLSVLQFLRVCFLILTVTLFATCDTSVFIVPCTQGPYAKKKELTIRHPE